MILPIGTSWYKEIKHIKYTSEYIPKLQIHQHSLLTRKVFSWNNSSSQVFITGSFIKGRSSSKLDHHWIIIVITSPTISSKWCYLSILLVMGSSTEPILFLACCRPNLHVGLHQQSQPFFMLDVLSFACKVFPYRASPFSCWMQHLSSTRISPT